MRFSLAIVRRSSEKLARLFIVDWRFGTSERVASYRVPVPNKKLRMGVIYILTGKALYVRPIERCLGRPVARTSGLRDALLALGPPR